MIRSAQKTFAEAFAKDEYGATAIDYGLFAALVGAVIVVSVGTLGKQTGNTFDGVATALGDANSAAKFATSTE